MTTAFRDVVRQAVEDDGMAAKEIEDWVEKTIYYQASAAGSPDDFKALATRIAQLEKERGQPPNRVFYLALPPNVFPATIQGLGEAGLGHGTTGEGNGTKYWTRLVIEKPFGRDLQSAEALNQLIHKYFDESQVYRIDHYLGKETVQNLLVFRFANSVFESLWNRDHVESVQVTVAEELGVEGRAGYYEQAGAVRDILQNHGIQLVSLVAMEVPAMMTAEFIRQEKVKALRSIKSITTKNVVLGQYAHGEIAGQTIPGYREEPGVAPTFSNGNVCRDQARDRQLAVAGRAVLPPDRQEAEEPTDRDRGEVPQAAGVDVHAIGLAGTPPEHAAPHDSARRRVRALLSYQGAGQAAQARATAARLLLQGAVPGTARGIPDAAPRRDGRRPDAVRSRGRGRGRVETVHADSRQHACGLVLRRGNVGTERVGGAHAAQRTEVVKNDRRNRERGIEGRERAE